MVEKKCECGETLNENFYKSRYNKCKKCIRKYQLDFYYKEKREAYKPGGKNYGKYKINIINKRYLGAKHRAIRKGLKFDIEESYIHKLIKEQDNKCKYSGIELDTSSIGSKNTFINHNTLSIDRIDSKKGYVEGNLSLVSSIVNSMKNNLSEEEFFSLIEKIYLKNLNP